MQLSDHESRVAQLIAQSPSLMGGVEKTARSDVREGRFGLTYAMGFRFREAVAVFGAGFAHAEAMLQQQAEDVAEAVRAANARMPPAPPEAPPNE